MASQIDPTKPATGVPADKAELRGELQAAKNEIEAVQAGWAGLGHEHVLAEITDAGALAGRNSISTTETDGGAVTGAELAAPRCAGHAIAAQRSVRSNQAKLAAKLLFATPIQFSTCLRHIATSCTYKAKIRRIQRTLSLMPHSRQVYDDRFLVRSRQFLQQYFGRYRDTRWHAAYAAANGNFATEYIPEDVFYNSIEPSFNSTVYADAFNDKNTLALIGLAPFGSPHLAHIVDDKPFDSSFKTASWRQLEAIIKNVDSEIVIKSSIGGVAPTCILPLRRKLGLFCKPS